VLCVVPAGFSVFFCPPVFSVSYFFSYFLVELFCFCVVVFGGGEGGGGGGGGGNPPFPRVLYETLWCINLSFDKMRQVAGLWGEGHKYPTCAGILKYAYTLCVCA